MSKDTYASILTEIRKTIKQIFNLRHKTIKFKEKVGKEKDKQKIGEIRKSLGL